MVSNPSTTNGQRKMPAFSSTHLGPNPDPRAQRKKPSKPPQNSVRPTHFLSLPLGHHPELRERIRELHQKVLPSGDVAVDIEGLDKSILVDPRRLHFTIGVMTLSSEDSPSPETQITDRKTLAEAIALLHSLAPEIKKITQELVMLSLDEMGVLKTKRKQAGVLYLGPSDESNESTIKLRRIFDLLSQRFRVEGFIEDSPRPAVLHCTLINASHRKPRRMPRTFSYREIFERMSPDTISSSSGILAQSSASDTASGASQDRTIKVDFGTWALSEIQLCRMGSHGPENEYISCASVPFC
ncbi:kinase A anchor protein [Mycena crocata]|nr:kinase A anchor protein [Mycena crocata]